MNPALVPCDRESIYGLLENVSNGMKKKGVCTIKSKISSWPGFHNLGNNEGLVSSCRKQSVILLSHEDSELVAKL